MQAGLCLGAEREAARSQPVLVLVQDALLARFCVLEGVIFPEQNTLPNTYYRAK